MKNIIESLFGTAQNKAIDEKYGEYYGVETVSIKCCYCDVECDPTDEDEAEFHESGECLHKIATDGYSVETGEAYIFGDSERTRQFCMEHILGSGYPEDMRSSKDKIISLIVSRINLLKALDEEVVNLPESAYEKLWVALGEFEWLNTYGEYVEQVREFCIGSEGIGEYSEWYCTTPLAKLYSDSSKYYAWIDTSRAI